ncbi:MAG: pantoate--beta-alanine ligase [Bacteroidetes bacterium]|nr:pantoate--beta-alanine ligase [Bacteroidota bacterium]
MKIFKSILLLNNFLNEIRSQNKTIGFVPTMGALHSGHLSLLKKSKSENDFTICSIFVNPKQFNNKEDLEKYPRNIEDDIEILKTVNCDILFCPSEEEMYPEKNDEIFDLGGLDKVMEGKYRPGHFNGVAIVVKRFFDIIMPNQAYFGEKDFQQMRIIQHIVGFNKMPIQIVPAPIERENDGLAMSSRNVRLNQEERKIAPKIYQTLLNAKEMAINCTFSEVINYVNREIASIKPFKLEYFEIVNIQNLKSVEDFSEKKNCIACIAVYLGDVRLIDNIILF